MPGRGGVFRLGGGPNHASATQLKAELTMEPTFAAPTGVERALNRLLGAMLRFGIGPSYLRLLEVRGRKTGRIYSTPVSLLEHDDKLWLVAPRGRTQWSKNVEASTELTLSRGSDRRRYKARLTSVTERPPLLKRYLDAYASAVQRFFTQRAGAPVEEFTSVAERYPVYELLSA